MPAKYNNDPRGSERHSARTSEQRFVAQRTGRYAKYSLASLALHLLPIASSSRP